MGPLLFSFIVVKRFLICDNTGMEYHAPVPDRGGVLLLAELEDTYETDNAWKQWTSDGEKGSPCVAEKDWVRKMIKERSSCRKL